MESMMEPEAPRYRAAAPRQYEQKPQGGGWIKWVVLSVLILAVLAAIGWFVWTNMRSVGTTIDTSKHQAVFLASGQVYFGKLEVLNDDYMKLSGVFYIQSNTASSDSEDGADPQSSSESNMQLIKLGNEVHGPEDMMIINRDQMLFFENLKTDGKVMQLIQSHNSGNR